MAEIKTQLYVCSVCGLPDYWGCTCEEKIEQFKKELNKPARENEIIFNGYRRGKPIEMIIPISISLVVSVVLLIFNS